MSTDIIIIIALLVTIAVLLVLFRIIDGMMKSKPKASEEKPKEEKAVKETPPPEPVKEIKEVVRETVIINNTRSLSDEILKSVKEEDKHNVDGYYRPPTERIRSYDRIRKYREGRNYVEYDSLPGKHDPAVARDADEDTDDIAENPYSREEYKKMMALLSKPVSDSDA